MDAQLKLAFNQEDEAIQNLTLHALRILMSSQAAEWGLDFLHFIECVWDPYDIENLFSVFVNIATSDKHNHELFMPTFGSGVPFQNMSTICAVSTRQRMFKPRIHDIVQSEYALIRNKAIR